MHWHWFHPFAAHAGQGTVLLALAVLVALAVDRLWGEPPLRWHPVVWMGSALKLLGERVAPSTPNTQNSKQFWLGALAWCALAAIVFVAFAVLQALVLAVWGAPVTVCTAVVDMPGLALGETSVVIATLRLLMAALLLGVLLKPLLSFGFLVQEVRAVNAALDQSLEAGRERLSFLVSRDVAQLSASEVRESAIESLAENLNDSVVAPLFWFAVAGLPGAALYRMANTADAMWGYRGMRGGRYWHWAGKWAARADDVLSWLPARITALLLVLPAPAQRLSALLREARKTPSPNSGWPMAAMALALNVRLTKPGVYRLHSAGRSPTPLDARRARHLAGRMVQRLVALAMLGLVLGCTMGRWYG